MACCQPLHQGTPAPDAERLMRARYSAYALKMPEYILETWHQDTRPESLTQADLQGIKWLKLEVLAHQQRDDTHAEVHFVATYQSAKQKKSSMTEHSQFERINGQWLYCGQVEK
ncbi:YchJ family protein [Methylophilus sp. 3sh_L]|uniref:YchJ family protein n=1 Tax=Methylophilus sp. 3sh_L TaxID=3377114 RepID=UPI00398EAF71